MFGTYLRLNVTVHDGWRAVVRAAAGRLTERSRKDKDPAVRQARKQFYRRMLEHHRQSIELVDAFRL